MKTLKRILLVVGVLIVLYLVAGLLMPRVSHYERSLTMNVPAEQAFMYLNDFRNFEKWSPWSEMDSTVVPTVEGGTGVGSKYSWTSEKMGAGTMIIQSVEPNSRINIGLLFEDQSDTNQSWFMLQPEDAGLKVTWAADIGIPFYMRPIAALFMRGIIEDAYSKGLENLKRELESGGAGSAGLVVKQVETPVLKAITLRKNGVKMQDISQVLGQAYGQIGAYLTSRNATMDSSVAPFAIYHKWDTTTFTTDIEIGMAVSAEVPGSGELKYRTFPVGRAAMVTFYGSYEQTPAAHMAVEAYLKQNNLQMAGSPWEFYVTDPMSERDTAKWRTDIYYPIP